jgi:hypothetical protein
MGADLYLDSFLQLIELSGRGFQLLRDTLVSYKSLAALPSTDGEKINTWVLQQSKVAGTNFAAYYKAWGWPVTDATVAALAALKLKAFPIPSNFNHGSPPPGPPPPSPPLPPMPPLVVPSRCEDYAAITKGARPVARLEPRPLGALCARAAAPGVPQLLGRRRCFRATNWELLHLQSSP